MLASRRSSPDAEKMKKTVDDLDAWYRQHIQHNRKYSAPALYLSSPRGARYDTTNLAAKGIT